ncbi:TIGR02646 family protein [Schinkia azotoformans MEV2011]|uniref:TIGR02646 family protein n=1 Tax=Schinkia azotoformans MEV2011 TaxID=1348973 RepID=A0A072P4H7_SCHAZ|nr:retron system putative HNH endonuclease [Schinkia azotoformans]KEF40385.1 TIGR02646 family protein [Schinkia azotoformans MEV2011]MEC1696202.1 TIGR02646 family protein [Schinkia azotoformans]MEC1725295.1 TIGR02646 family protein [Schinkia azotoformans]
MITLKKIDQPQILKDKSEEWKNDLLDYINKGEKPPESIVGRYRHKEIKEALKKETHHKCAYCESKITHIDFGHIEHIVPKSIIHEKTYDWQNLTLACGTCNTNKGTYYDKTMPLLNPYKDKPENEIIFLGPVPMPRPGSNIGIITIKKLKLNRPELLERRKELIDKIMPLLHLYEQTTNDSLRIQLYEDIIEYTKPDKEYSSMVKGVLDQLKITS